MTRLIRTLLLCLVSGCAARPAILYGPAQELTASDYGAVLRTWTRGAKIYQVFEDKLFLTATYHSPEFRRAFAVAFPDIYGHGGQVTRRELVDLTGDVEQYHTFFVVAYTADRKWNDFEQGDSIWRMTLTSSEKVSVDLEEVLSVKIDENIRAVYSYIGRFDKAYLVRFPLTDPLNKVVIGPRTKFFSLRVASALGVAEPKWELTTSAAPQTPETPSAPEPPAAEAAAEILPRSSPLPQISEDR